MEEKSRKIVSDLIDACVKSIDPSKSFADQVTEITAKLQPMLPIVAPDIQIDDPELEELIKSKVVIEEEPPVIFAKGYNPWLNEVRGQIKWNYYDRFEKYLVKEKEWNWGTVQSINDSSDIILDHMHNPKSNDYFNIKGLVMGDIQSGKTANYTALINKALDCGYKLIIVLAGLTKDLRSQTQKRLDKEVLGYETRSDFQKGNPIGVGLIDKSVLNITAITHSGDSGDLKKSTAEAITTTLTEGMTPLIAVLKKNSSVLNALIQNVLKTDGKFDVPVLIIDDEVDQASVNTQKSEAIDEASSINRLIRQMLSKFNRYAYVGYTATPFANVFINPYGFEKEEDKDIFPEDFIICLSRPSNYCGVKEYFGFDTLESEDDDALTKDLYVKIDDYYELFDDEIKYTKKVKVDTPVVRINKSLHQAFMHFIIASAVKHSRGIVEHNSMLIHIARFKNPATSLRELVKDHISGMFKEYKYGTDEDREVYKQYWEENIKPVSQERLSDDFHDDWEDISKYIALIFQMTLNGIKIVNGDSADVCDYESSDVGQHIIIGGDKLSRGLTLEGLMVSYYYRKSRTYDALLQMGRWFGYRNGWIDLCRIFTVNQFVNDFINAGIATEKFKQDVEEMNSQKLTPAEFGLKVKYSPHLVPTSASKMRGAKKQKVSFSNSIQQVLTYQKEYVEDNRKVTNDFLLSQKGEKAKSGNYVYRNLPASVLIDYLSKYKECDELVGSVSIKNWVKYIEKANDRGELSNWTVILHTNANNGAEDSIAGNSLFKSQYSDRNLDTNDSSKNFYLKAIVDQTDFRDFYVETSKEYSKVLKYSSNNETILNSFTNEYGVLSIYVMDIHKKEISDKVKVDEKTGKVKRLYKPGDILCGGTGVVGLCVWFSKSQNYEDSAIEYYVNPVFQKMQLEADKEEEEE